MKIRTPTGGFLAAKVKKNIPLDLINRVTKSGAQLISYESKGVLMASWKDFSGQGLWSDNDVAVAYDVAITNEKELLSMLEPSEQHQKETGELLWLLYRKMGIKFIDRLRGAFAFSIWNGHELIVVTDFFGIRPIVYAHTENQFMAASRISHLLMDNTISKEIDPDAIYHYLFFQAVCSPVSIYKSVKKLEPGKGLKFKHDMLMPFTHYDIQYKPLSNHDEKYWARATRTTLEKTMKKYAITDTYDKTGCFLSGGTDSSSIAGYYSKILEKPAKTFSIGFAEPKYNELDFARIAVNRFGTQQHEYCVTPGDVVEFIEMLPKIYDEPFGNASVFPAYYCAKLAKENGIETLLGGDGGDEIFGGNERYVTNLLFQKYFSLPRILRNFFLEPCISALPSKGLIYKAKNYIRRANMGNPKLFYSYNLLAEVDPAVIFQRDFLKKIDTNCFLSLAEKLYNNNPEVHDTDRLLYIDMKLTITDNDLRKVTQMVESAGLQVQYPLLDRDLVDFSATIPPDLKVKPGKNRYIFKKAMQGFLPDEILQKSKHGMGLPISLWFKTNKDLSEILHDRLFTPQAKIRSYLDSGFIHRIKVAFESDKSSYFGDNLWVFLVLEDWLLNH